MTTMKHARVWMLMFAATAAGSTFAQTTDILVGAIEPLQLGRERNLFLRAAGADSVLTEDEFKASASSGGGFVRTFDQWAELLRMDADNDKKIDWSEATHYRQSLRDRVLAAFDANGNGRLEDAEKVAAAKDLAAGKLPKPLPESRPRIAQRPAPGGAAFSVPNTPARPAAGTANLTAEQRKAVDVFSGVGEPLSDPADYQKLQLAWDADGDGQLNQEEMREMSRAMQARNLELWDKNGDGQVDQEEQALQMAEMQKRGMEMNEKFMRAQFEKMADEDGDGKISPDEEANIEKMLAFQRKQMEGMQRLTLQKYDANGNGQIDGPEAMAMQKEQEGMMEKMMSAQNELNAKFDMNGNGMLDTPEEMQAMQKKFESYFDKNKDGRTTLSEQLAAMEEMMPLLDKDGDGVIWGDEQFEAQRIMMERMFKD